MNQKQIQKTRASELAETTNKKPKGKTSQCKERKNLLELFSQITELRLAQEYIKTQHEILKGEIEGLKLYLDSLGRPAKVAVDAVADDLESLGIVICEHTHDQRGAAVVPASMLKRGIRCKD